MAPFMLLTLSASLLVWTRVYMYGILGVASTMAFFAAPAKQWLIQRLKQRNQNALQLKEKYEQPMMGLPSDPGAEIDEAVREIREEVEVRRRRGQSISMPTGTDMKAAVEDKLGGKL